MLAADRERVARALEGDQEAFTDLVVDYNRAVYNLTYRMLGDTVEAEDAAQEAFLRAYRNLDRYDQQRSFKTWVLSIASHYCIDVIRKRRMSWLSLDDFLPGEVMAAVESRSVEELAMDGERGRTVQELLKLLKPDERAIIILRYWNDLSYEEIAEMLHTNVGVIKSRLFRARQAFANRIKVRELGLVLSPA
ncbi:MAG: sigma-70 family RNA polymerase sigma factor [Anaerolineae bacterium]|nr:sigma-70 family RNA polymerase sigma factor [Anaerolineae bacterium]